MNRVVDSLVIVKPFNVLGNDERGVTAEFALPRKQEDFVFITRKKGSLSGNTYHAGKSEATNPKVFVLLSGKVVFSYRKIGESEKHEVEVQSPALIEVQPNVTHKMEALEDFTVLECNSIKDIQDDRMRETV